MSGSTISLKAMVASFFEQSKLKSENIDLPKFSMLEKGETLESASSLSIDIDLLSRLGVFSCLRKIPQPLPYSNSETPGILLCMLLRAVG